MNLNWTPSITGNVTAQRASKRKKAVGGAFDTTGFTPANNMGTGVSSATTTVLNNIIYEFKIENLCTTGGPTLNNNGIIEQIKFACILPAITRTSTTININISLVGLDITKVRYVLKKQSDSSTIATHTINKVSDNVPDTFTGLDPATGYYFTIEMYTTINGGEVISSNVAYLNAVCGGNVTGYQISTDIETVSCLAFTNNTGEPIAVDYTTCHGGQQTVMNPGQIICAVEGTLEAADATLLSSGAIYCSG